MAFFNKLGATLRQNIYVSSSMNAQPAMLNAIRCMSSRLFVGGLSHETDDQGLKEAFSSYGDVTEARVIIDRDSGKSRGLGFVSFADDECANSALSAMDGQDLNGRAISVSLAQEKAPRSSYGGAGGGGGFRGYGNGGGKMRSLLSNRTNTNTLIESIKIKSVYQSASLIAQDISLQLRTKKTRSFRSIFSKVVKNIPLVMKKRVKGIRICCSGRLKGAKIARTECGKYGKISRNVFSQKIDYAPAEVSTRYGNLGVKVWISYSQKRKGPAIS